MTAIIQSGYNYKVATVRRRRYLHILIVGGKRVETVGVRVDDGQQSESEGICLGREDNRKVSQNPLLPNEGVQQLEQSRGHVGLQYNHVGPPEIHVGGGLANLKKNVNRTKVRRT